MKQGNLKFEPLPIESKTLFEQLCTEKKLLEGWQEVKRNKGSSGIDGQTIETFQIKLREEIKQLKQELETWQYTPNPVRRVEIPKADGGVRELGVPCIRDRIVQTAIKQLLEPILDPGFSENSYGFRPGKNQRQAVETAQEIVNTGKGYVVDIDLSKFFDRVNQDRLISRLGKLIEDKRILRIVGMTLRSGVMQKGIFTNTLVGTVQGSPLSPILSNLVLDELDKEIERRGLEHCRFADDCNIFVKTKKAAERVMENISKFIEQKLKLVINWDKSKVAESHLVKFLGMTIVNGARAIAKKTMDHAMKKIKELTPRSTHETLDKTIKRVNEWYMGWSQYYSMTQYPSQLNAIEAHTRRRLRARMVEQQKNRRNLFNKLIARGVSEELAGKACFNNMQQWAISHTKAVERAYPNKWFIMDMKLVTRSHEKRTDWFELKRWVRLT
jgi:group II intron reverse transcriptase/maturase